MSAAAVRPQPVSAIPPLLVCGVVAGPFYLAVGLIQALTRDGFDLARHSLSVLANGPGGWIQTANFALTGLMVIAAATGIGRALPPGSRAVRWFLGGYGISMIAAAFFRADPVDGFPPGTPAGFPASISTMGLMHFVAGALGFTCLALSGLVIVPALRRRGASGLALLSGLSGLAVAAGFFGGFLIPGLAPGVTGIWFAVVVGWAWLSALCVQLGRAPAP